MDSVELATCASELIDKQFAEMVTCCDLAKISASADRSPVGKRLLGAFYIHVSALPNLDPMLQSYEQAARRYLQQAIAPTLINFSTAQFKVSYLFYPDCDRR